MPVSLKCIGLAQTQSSPDYKTGPCDGQRCEGHSCRGVTSNAERHNADSFSKYKLYFDLLQAKIAEYSVEAEHTYNMDEKGFMIGVTARTKHVFSRRMWEKKEVRATLQDGNRA